MAGEVTGIEHPATIGAGTLATMTAKLAGGSADAKKLKWTYTEPHVGAKPQPLASGAMTVIYIPPMKLVGKNIKITAKNGKTAAFETEIPVTKETAKVPTATVKCELPPGWDKKLADHAVSINGGAPFLVGRKKSWRRPNTKTQYTGLTFSDRFAHFTFDPDEYPKWGHWPELVSCSTAVEGRGAYEALNTWDHTHFTFGLIQFTARAYDADFHLFLRNAFIRYPAQAGFYFPELKIVGKDFYGMDPATQKWVQLTDKSDLQNTELRRFLKPVATEVTPTELRFAGRLFHWTRAEPGVRQLMVELAVERAKAHMRTFGELLHGKGIAECAVVFDIRLHGRDRGDGFPKVRKALKAGKPLQELFAIFDPPDAERMKAYRKLVEAKFAGSQVKYDKDSNDLIGPGDV